MLVVFAPLSRVGAGEKRNHSVLAYIHIYWNEIACNAATAPMRTVPGCDVVIPEVSFFSVVFSVMLRATPFRRFVSFCSTLVVSVLPAKPPLPLRGWPCWPGAVSLLHMGHGRVDRMFSVRLETLVEVGLSPDDCP